MTSSAIRKVSVEAGQVKGNEYIGGIAGYVNNNAAITDCSNNAKVIGQNYTGGIAGIAFYGTTISSSNNSGVVEGKSYTGGIAGYSQAQIEKVYNDKEIKGEEFIAGIVGANFTMGDVSKSYNKGNISGVNNVGGIVGTNNASVTSVYNTGDIKTEGYRAGGICGQNATDSFIYNSYNIGKVEGLESVGGVVGGDFGTITNCYYLESSIEENNESEFSKTEEDLKNNLFEDLGVEFVQDKDGKINQGFPILSFQ